MSDRDNLIQQAQQRGLKPGMIISCALDGVVGVVDPKTRWVLATDGVDGLELKVGKDKHGYSLYAYIRYGWSDSLPMDQAKLTERVACECTEAVAKTILLQLNLLGWRVGDIKRKHRGLFVEYGTIVSYESNSEVDHSWDKIAWTEFLKKGLNGPLWKNADHARCKQLLQKVVDQCEGGAIPSLLLAELKQYDFSK